MNTINKILAYLFFITAAILFICGFFKGSHVFLESFIYVAIGICLSDTANAEETQDNN